MTQRNGERLGWIGGGLGGFLWLLIFSVLGFIRSNETSAFLSLAFFLAGLACILLFAPWRHPGTQYWKLMLPMYLILFSAIGSAVWISGSPARAGLHWSSYLWTLPLLVPFATVGKRRWEE